MSGMAVQRMDNVGIVVDDLPATNGVFRELGLELEGRTTIEGEWSGRVTGLRDQRVEVAMMRTPDGHSRIELSRFPAPPGGAARPPPPGPRAGPAGSHSRVPRRRQWSPTTGTLR